MLSRLASEAGVRRFPKWEALGATPGVFVRVANKGLIGAYLVRVANKRLSGKRVRKSGNDWTYGDQTIQDCRELVRVRGGLGSTQARHTA
jgi:hypothetical protein